VVLRELGKAKMRERVVSDWLISLFYGMSGEGVRRLVDEEVRR